MTFSLVFGILSTKQLYPLVSIFFLYTFLVSFMSVCVLCPILMYSFFYLSYIVFYYPLKIYLFSNERQKYLDKSRWKGRWGGVARHKERRNCNTDIM